MYMDFQLLIANCELSAAYIAAYAHFFKVLATPVSGCLSLMLPRPCALLTCILVEGFLSMCTRSNFIKIASISLHQGHTGIFACTCTTRKVYAAALAETQVFGGYRA